MACSTNKQVIVLAIENEFVGTNPSTGSKYFSHTNVSLRNTKKAPLSVLPNIATNPSLNAASEAPSNVTKGLTCDGSLAISLVSNPL